MIFSLPYHYFTSEKRHYEMPDDVSKFDEMPELQKLPTEGYGGRESHIRIPK